VIKYLLTCIVFVSTISHADFKQHDVNNFIDFMYDEHSYNKDELRKLFQEIKTEPRIKKYFKKAPERTLTWNGCAKKDKSCTNYKSLFVTKKNIQKGIKFWLENTTELNAAEEKFGVPAEIIVAIIGIESRYGSRTGTFKTFDTLASLALGPNKGRRAKFYKSELINFLLLCKENNFNPRNIKGSYAGALGKPQFISSSYRNYAIDFNDDSKVDLWNSNGDVIGSVANYFKKNGWRSGMPIMSQIIFEESEREFVDSESKKSYKPKTPYKYFKTNNVYVNDKISEKQLLSVIARKEKSGKVYSFGHKNFYVITRYNRSRLYALAVYYLSLELKKSKTDVEI